MGRPTRADLARSRFHTAAGEVANEARRPPSADVEARHREEWPSLWRTLDGLADDLEALQRETGSIFLPRRRR